MKHHQLSKLSFIYLPILCLLIITIPSVAVSGSPRTETSSSLVSSDEIDDLILAARTGIQAIDDFVKIKNTEIAKKKNETLANYSQSQVTEKDLAGMYAMIEKQSTSTFVPLEYDVNEDQIAQIRTTLGKLTSLYNTQIGLFSQIFSLTKDAKDAVVAKPVFTGISEDRTKAAKLIEAIKTNNRNDISDLLKQQTSGLILNISQIKNISELTVVFRVGQITHCVSNKLVCNGSRYSLIK